MANRKEFQKFNMDDDEETKLIVDGLLISYFFNYNYYTTDATIANGNTISDPLIANITLAGVLANGLLTTFSQPGIGIGRTCFASCSIACRMLWHSIAISVKCC